MPPVEISGRHSSFLGVSQVVALGGGWPRRTASAGGARTGPAVSIRPTTRGPGTVDAAPESLGGPGLVIYAITRRTGGAERGWAVPQTLSRVATTLRGMGTDTVGFPSIAAREWRPRGHAEGALTGWPNFDD